MLSGAPTDYMVEYQNWLGEFLFNIQETANIAKIAKIWFMPNRFLGSSALVLF